MKYFEYEISGIDGSAAKFVGYCLDNSEEVVPDRVRPSVLVIPGGGYQDIRHRNILDWLLE